MQRSTLAALPLCLVLLSCFQAGASPIPRNFHPLKDSPSGCLTVVFFLALSLTILFGLKKVYVSRRCKIDPVLIFSDEFSVSTCNQKGGRSITKAIAKKSGFYVGLLGSPIWETKRSVLIGGGPGSIFLPPENHTPSYRRAPSGLLMTTLLQKMPVRCEITSTRPAHSNILGDKLQPLHITVLSPVLSRPPLAIVSLKHPSDTKSSLWTRRLSSPLITQVDQHNDFQNNESITLSSGPRNLTLPSGLNSLQSRTDHSKVSSVSSFADVEDERRLSSTYNSSAADIAIQTFRTSARHVPCPTDLLENSIQQSTIKPLHFGSISKRRFNTISEKSRQLYSEDDSILETAVQDFAAVSPPKASQKIPDLPKWTRNSPTIGPSPLRTMSLPSDYDLEHTKKSNVNDCGMLYTLQSQAKFEPSLDSPPTSGHSSSIPKRSKMILQADDHDIIFDLIRELAQETSAWDASLFVDEKFKALMDQSKTHPSCKLKIQPAQQKWPRYRRKQRRTTTFVPLQDIPESDVATIFLEENDNSHSNEAQSSWEDENYQHNKHQPPSLSKGEINYHSLADPIDQIQ